MLSISDGIQYDLFDHFHIMQVQVIPKSFSNTFPQHAGHWNVDYINGLGENIRIRSVVDRDLQVVVVDVRS